MNSMQRYSAPPPATTSGGAQNLADILERVLDKGIVIAGDIKINLLDIELLTIKLRLLIASVDKAQEIGINWWGGDPFLSGDARALEEENQDLRRQLDRLEERLDALGQGSDDTLPASQSEATQTSEAETNRP